MKQERNQTLEQVSFALGYDRQTVRKWVKEGCPHDGGPVAGKGGGYKLSLREVTDWLADRAVRNALGDVDITDTEEAKRRKVVAEAGLAELELAKQRGDVVEIADIAKIVERQCHEVRVRMLGIEPKAPLIRATASDAAAKDLLGNFIREALSGFTGYSAGETGASVAKNAGLDSGESPETATEMDD